MRGNEQIALLGIEVWAFLIEEEDGYRLQLPLDDWKRCNLSRGERIAMQRWRGSWSISFSPRRSNCRRWHGAICGIRIRSLFEPQLKAENNLAKKRSSRLTARF